MQPSVGPKLNSFFDRKGLVTRPVIYLVGLVVQNARPKDGLSSLGHYSDVEVIKFGPSPGRYIIQVQKQSEDSHTTLSLGMIGDVVVVAARRVQRSTLKICAL